MYLCFPRTPQHGVIHSLDKSKATGYDGLSVKILKIASPVLVLPLTNLFNKCIITSEFPKQLKRANVSPLFKKDNPLVKKNYRPVSILTSISKIFEKLLAF